MRRIVKAAERGDWDAGLAEYDEAGVAVRLMIVPPLVAASGGARRCSGQCGFGRTSLKGGS